jgi:hypothetical protein
VALADVALADVALADVALADVALADVALADVALLTWHWPRCIRALGRCSALAQRPPPSRPAKSPRSWRRRSGARVVSASSPRCMCSLRRSCQRTCCLRCLRAACATRSIPPTSRQRSQMMVEPHHPWPGLLLTSPVRRSCLADGRAADLPAGRRGLCAAGERSRRRRLRLGADAGPGARRASPVLDRLADGTDGVAPHNGCCGRAGRPSHTSGDGETELDTARAGRASDGLGAGALRSAHTTQCDAMPIDDPYISRRRASSTPSST